MTNLLKSRTGVINPNSPLPHLYSNLLIQAWPLFWNRYPTVSNLYIEPIPQETDPLRGVTHLKQVPPFLQCRRLRQPGYVDGALNARLQGLETVQVGELFNTGFLMFLTVAY